MNPILNSPAKIYTAVVWLVLTLWVGTGRFGPVGVKTLLGLVFFTALCWATGWLEDDKAEKSWGGHHALLPAATAAAAVLWFYPFENSALWWGASIIAAILSCYVVLSRIGENLPESLGYAE